MSSGVNVKVISQRQSDAGVSSSLPLPRSMLPLSKMDPKQQYSGLPNPTVHYQHAAKRQPSYSSSSVSSGPAELLRGAALKNHLLQQKSSVYSHRSPAATERSDGTCSAYSSPQVPKREVPRSKDTLDLRNSMLTQKALRDLQLRRNVNKNWTFGKYRLRSVDNADDDDALCRVPANVQQIQGRGRHLFTKSATNGNEISAVSTGGTGNSQKEMRNISNQERGASEGQVSSDKSKSSYQTFNMPRRGSEPGKVNMAAVAPFRFRFQIHEDTDASLDDLSDCSSDSMEVCCDDLGESV
ncbi:neuron navigator 1 isoform X1 [Lates japonicus]|uniref:Neuron navigator 1 isoform X1 n=1 Tax=Lates japonicus TaxID=270547 RepID=A0AAD3N0T4_LATJO|nr:neuron navigator 1 isoform X1 [Lates japonicus]